MTSLKPFKQEKQWYKTRNEKHAPSCNNNVFDILYNNNNITTKNDTL